ncbi:4-hydroxybenzoate polyprenyltransferase [Planctomycetaceae bacterium]|nr:4-hydroxybenzoate polyprenyltransferase [Planctomycetaceae bacterium]
MLSTVRTYASFVKFSHTVFALPFAIAGMVAAYAVPTKMSSEVYGHIGGEHATDGPLHVPFSWIVLLLILCCMVGARSFAMAVNRILDRRIDALNPRTAQREIPAGVLSLRAAWLFALASALLYFGACSLIGEVVLALSPIPVALMLLYPYTKRFTALCHLVLGASLGLAPIGAWVAVRGERVHSFQFADGSTGWRVPGIKAVVLGSDFPNHFYGIGWQAVTELTPWLLGAAVMLWVAGFDVIYALQDDEFDRANKLHSIPAALGRKRALQLAILMHVSSYGFFFFFVDSLMKPALIAFGEGIGTYTQLDRFVWAAPFVMFAGMLYQHSLVKPNDLSRVNVAFFTVNGVISVIFGAIFVAAWLLA